MRGSVRIQRRSLLWRVLVGQQQEQTEVGREPCELRSQGDYAGGTSTSVSSSVSSDWQLSRNSDTNSTSSAGQPSRLA